MSLTWRILIGDVRETLKSLPDGCAQTCVTSPPFWGLRDYGTATWDGGDATCDHREVQAQNRPGRETPGGRGGSFPTSERAYKALCGKCGASRIDAQLGLEATPEAYTSSLVAVFAEVRRVLADDGTVWANLGDSYASAWAMPKDCRNLVGQGGLVDGTRDARPNRLVGGLKEKDLVGIPWRAAFALQADGWYLRSDIIWSKPNPMPESVTDRPTKAHEYIFLLSKSPRYYYDAAAIREPYAPSTLREFQDGYEGQATKPYAGSGAQNASDVKRRIVDKQRGHGRRHAGFNDRWDAMPKDEQQQAGANKRSVWHVATQPYPDAHFATYPEKLIEPCILAGSKPGDTVLDPFTGSGTTGVVAIGNGRNFIGCELNPAYVELAEKRIGSVAPLFAERTA